MNKKIDNEKILSRILDIDRKNIFLKYLVRRLRSDEYRGWHVSQHNRYGLDDIKIILQKIYEISSDKYFAIPPGDYRSDCVLDSKFRKFQNIVNNINSKMGRGTINSIKKNFFPDLERMGFLERKKFISDGNFKSIIHGKLTKYAIAFIKAGSLIQKYKKFTDGIDKLFGNKISELAEIIHLSDYINDPISIYEFMFIFSDNSEGLDKIKLLDAYRGLRGHNRTKVIDLVKEYANPDNFSGNKTARRDFHNWKNQSQQMMNLLKTTVYFEVDRNKYFRLNVNSKTGFFQKPVKRSAIAKRDYFDFHDVQKKNKFELHHIIPIASAKNQEEAKMIDDHRNLIYIHHAKHKQISRSGNRHVVLTIDISKASFSDFERTSCITAKNNSDALYSKIPRKIAIVSQHNIDLLNSIFEYSNEQ